MNRKNISQILEAENFEHTLLDGVIGEIQYNGETVIEVRDTRIFSIKLKGCGKTLKHIEDEDILKQILHEWVEIFNETYPREFRYYPSEDLLNNISKPTVTTESVVSEVTPTQSSEPKKQFVDNEVTHSLVPEDFVYITRKLISGNTDYDELDWQLNQTNDVLIKGPTGSGKTTLVRKYCAVNKLPYKRISLNGATTIEDLVGHYILKSGNSPWVPGVLERAMKEGWILVLDEINSAADDVLFVLNAVLDDERTLIMPQKDGEVVKAHPNFRIVATINPAEDGYSGTHEMNGALVDRFVGSTLVIDYDENGERKILRQMGVETKTCDKIMAFTKALRNAYQKGEITTPWSTRGVINLANLIDSNRAKMIVYHFRSDEITVIADMLDMHIFTEDAVDQEQTINVPDYANQP